MVLIFSSQQKANRKSELFSKETNKMERIRMSISLSSEDADNIHHLIPAYRLAFICPLSSPSSSASFIHLELGKLMYDAYLNTVDFEGETVTDAQEEVKDTLSGKYGDIIPEVSMMVLTSNNKESDHINGDSLEKEETEITELHGHDVIVAAAIFVKRKPQPDSSFSLDPTSTSTSTSSDPTSRAKDSPPNSDSDSSCLLAYVMTSPAHQAQGLASFLIRQGVQRLYSLGYTSCQLMVNEDNRHAINLYSQLGFSTSIM